MVIGNWVLNMKKSKNKNYAAIFCFVLLCLLASACIPVQSDDVGSDSSGVLDSDPTNTVVPRKEVITPETLPMITSAPQQTVLAPTAIPQVSPAPTQILTPTLEANMLTGPLLGFRMYDDEGSLLSILDMNTYSFRELRGDFGNPFGMLWFGNGCQLYTFNGLIDLQGRTTWHLPEVDWEIILPIESSISRVGKVSPDQQWYAYDIWYGEQGYADPEFKDIGIINLEDTENPILLTDNGRATSFAWSPDSQWLAYKNDDENGMPQLFITKPDGTMVTQLTSHTEPFGLGYMIWSPDGRYIAYSARLSKDGGETGTGWVDIVNVEDRSLKQIKPEIQNFGGVRMNALWWNLDSARLLFSGRDWNDAPDETQIYWVDVYTGKIEKTFFASDVPDGYIEQVFAAGDIDHILFGSYQAFYLLDAVDISYELTPIQLDVKGDIYEVESSPFSFPGEENCQY